MKYVGHRETKRVGPRFSEAPRAVKFTETKEKAGCRGVCLMETEFRFGEMRKFWRWVRSRENVLNATEPYT